MPSIQKVVAVQDESSHWYVIPFDLKEEFDKLSDDVYNAYNNVDVKEAVLINLETSFHDKFGKFRTGGDLNNVQLYAEI